VHELGFLNNVLLYRYLSGGIKSDVGKIVLKSIFKGWHRLDLSGSG